MLSNSENEIDRFKRNINLSEFAASVGYDIDRKESTRSSVVMRGPGDDKLIITINSANGHWIYFSIRDDADNGTIIDFVQKRFQCHLGKLREMLRPWIGESPNPPKCSPKNHYAEKVEPVSKDIARVMAEFSAMQPINGFHPYLINERCIPSSVLADPRFAHKVRIDRFRNAVFPHYNAAGLCGYEIKNYGFTGFSRGGQKGMWASSLTSSDDTLVIVESAIDALSYHVLYQPGHARYISISGSLNPEQPKLIQSAISKLPSNAQLIIATDNDDGGDILATEIRKSAEDSRREDVSVTERRPDTRGYDWNDVLRALSAR